MIEKYVVSLDLAKKLKEAGFPQGGGGFYWVKYRLEDIDTSPEDEHFADPLVNPDAPVFKKYSLLYLSVWDYKFRFPANIVDFVKAPLAEEILGELPVNIETRDNVIHLYYLTIERGEDDKGQPWIWVKYETPVGEEWIIEEDAKLSNALAHLWLWLKEHGYLEERDEAGKNL